jgi:hypothetical protein
MRTDYCFQTILSALDKNTTLRGTCYICYHLQNNYYLLGPLRDIQCTTAVMRFPDKYVCTKLQVYGFREELKGNLQIIHSHIFPLHQSIN